MILKPWEKPQGELFMKILEELRDLKLDNMWMKAELA
jgi:hypothetical protein